MKTIKRILTLAFILMIAQTLNAQVWQAMSSGVTTTLNAVAALDNQNAVAVGISGVILRTTDGGINWNQVTSNTSEDLNAVSFPTSTVGFAAGNNGTVLKTTNGGSTWTSVNVPVAIGLNAVHFTTSSIGYVAGNSGYMYRTIDGGSTWVALTTGYGANNIQSVFFTSDCTGWFTGTAWYGTYSSVDCGATWNYTNTPDPGISYDLYFTNASTGFVVNDHGTIIKTTDGGASFSSVFSTSLGIYSIWFHTGSIGWAVGSNGRLWETTDGGSSWTEHSIGNSSLYGVHFYNSYSGYAVGSNGTILKYYDQFPVSFHVKDINSVPISGATVSFNGVSQTTDASGNTTFNDIIEGIYAYLVEKTGYDTYSNTVAEPGNTNIQVTLAASPCTQPNSGYASGITLTSANLSWNAGGSESLWNLQWGTQGFSMGSGTIVSNLTNPAYSLTGLLTNTTYDYYIQSDCGAALSSWSGPYSFTTLNAGLNTYANPTSCGLNFSITDNNCPTDDQFYINVGSAPGTSLGSDVELASVRVIITHTYVNDLSFSLVSPNGIEVILCSNKGGDSDDFGVNDGTCTQYTEFTMSAVYNISAGTYPFIGAFLPDGNFTTFNDGSSPIGNWRFQICDNSAQDVGAVQYVELVFSNYTALEEVSGNAEISISPNPAKDLINISSFEKIRTVRIFSLTGEEISNITINASATLIDLSDLPSGIYLLKTEQCSGKISNNKIIKE